MFVGPIAGVTPLSRLQKLPRPQCRCRSGSCIETPAAPDQSQISGLGKGTRLFSHTDHRPLTVERNFSPSYVFETGGHREKHHKFQLYKARSLQTTLFIYKYQT
jgi:hypothetical protein